LGGLGCDGYDVVLEAEHSIEGYPQDFGGLAKGNRDAVNGDIRPDIKLSVPMGKQSNLRLVWHKGQLFTAGPFNNRSKAVLQLFAENIKVCVGLQDGDVVGIGSEDIRQVWTIRDKKVKKDR
jgi:hypothetical protein